MFNLFRKSRSRRAGAGQPLETMRAEVGSQVGTESSETLPNPGHRIDPQHPMPRRPSSRRELAEQRQQWKHFSQETSYMLAVFRWKRRFAVDVLRVNDAVLGKGRSLRLMVDAPQVRRRRFGNSLEWDKSFELPIEAVYYHEPLHQSFHADGNSAYRKLLEKGRKIADELEMSRK